MKNKFFTPKVCAHTSKLEKHKKRVQMEKNMEEKRILAILKTNYDFQIDGIEFLRDSGGTVYIVNSGEQKFLLKIAKKAFQDTICQSVDILSYLSENQFPVPAVIQTKSGAFTLEVMDEEQEHLFILYQYIEGNEPELRLCGERVGELAGKLHKLLPAYQGKLTERDVLQVNFNRANRVSTCLLTLL